MVAIFFLLKICEIWLKFESQHPKGPVLELTWSHLRSSEHILLQDIGIWPWLQYSGQRLMHWFWSIIIFPKMLHLKCQFENLAEISFFSPLDKHFWIKHQYLSPTFVICLHRNFTKNVNLADILHLEAGVTQNNLNFQSIGPLGRCFLLVDLSICVCVCSLLRYRLNVFLPPLREVGCPKFLEIWNPWGKVMKRSDLTFEHFCLKIVKNCRAIFFFFLLILPYKTWWKPRFPMD